MRHAGAIAAALLLARISLPAAARAEAPIDVTQPPVLPSHDAVVELAKPFSETRVKRFENVFFIAVPFAALYASLLTTVGGAIIQGSRFSVTPRVVAIDLGAAAAIAAWIAGRDMRAQRAPEPQTPEAPSIPPSPALSATETGPSSTLMR